jgi:hypothetical protein
LVGKEHPDYDPITFYGDLLWTRVKARSQFDVKRIVTFELGPDIDDDSKEVKHTVKN